MGASHDNSELSFEVELEEPDELVGLEVHRSGIVGHVEEVHRVRSVLLW